MKRSGMRSSCVVGRTSWTGVVSFSAMSVLVVRLVRSGGLHQLGIRIADRRQVRRARARVELFEKRIVRRLLLQLRNGRLRIVHVAEYDGVGRACLLAG